MTYIENPKLRGSNVLGCVPQKGPCPFKCPDCFAFRPGAYLGEHGERTPNIPTQEQAEGKIVRINDINDSSYQVATVLKVGQLFKHRFYNTATTSCLHMFDAPVVLTANGRTSTDTRFLPAKNVEKLMFVRARVNAWNTEVVQHIIDYYTSRGVPVVLTFMAYYETELPVCFRSSYEYKKRTLNSYFCPTEEFWCKVVKYFRMNNLVYTCGKDAVTYTCSECRNCEKLYVRYRLTHDLDMSSEEVGELLDLLDKDSAKELFEHGPIISFGVDSE